MKKVKVVVSIIFLVLLSFNINFAKEYEKISVKYYQHIDGDTVKLKKGEQIITVRFLGIDTPETVHKTKGEQPYGREASDFTKQKMLKAKLIEIEYDINSLKQDKYGRELAWIWVDGKLLQEELVENGLARTYMLKNKYKYAEKLKLAEIKAKSNKIKIWGLNNVNLEKNGKVISNKYKGKKITNKSVKKWYITLVIFAILHIFRKKIKKILRDKLKEKQE